MSNNSARANASTDGYSSSDGYTHSSRYCRTNCGFPTIPNTTADSDAEAGRYPSTGTDAANFSDSSAISAKPYPARSRTRRTGRDRASGATRR